MDKKLILNIENIEFKTKKGSSNSNSIDEIKKNLDLLPKILKVFEKIEINRLKINDNEFQIILNDEVLYLDNKYINLSSKIDINSKQVEFELYSLYLKDIDLLLDGKVKVDYFNEKLNYYGKFYYQDIVSNLNLEMTKDLAKFYLESEPFKNIKFLKKFLSLPQVAEEWMYDNVEGDMKLQEFYGEYNLKKNEIIESSLVGKAQINAAKIRFHKDVDIVNTKELNISFKNSELHFELIEPIFKDKKLDGSYVTIHDIASEKNGQIDVFLKTQSKLDEDILNILKAYDIKLPVIQKNGDTQASLLMKFPYDISKSMSTYGEFFVSDADIFIDKFSFKSKYAEVILNDSIVEIKNSDFNYKNMINADVNLSLDTKTLKAQGDANIKSFLIKKDKDEIVNIKDKSTLLELDFNDNVTVILKDLGTKINVSDLVYVNIDDLSIIYPHSKLLNDLSIKEGNIALQIKDEKNISFDALIKNLELPIQKDEKPIDFLEISGKIENDKTKISSKNGDINIELGKTINLSLQNIDVILNSKLKNSSIKKDTNISLTNTKLKVDEDLYHLENAKIAIKNKGIDFEVNVKDLNLPIRKNDNKVETLNLIGNIKNGVTTINTRKKDLILELKKDLMTLYVDGYNLYYSSSDIGKDDEKSKNKNISIKGKNSNIILNDKYTFLTNDFEVRVKNDDKYINLNYKQTNIVLKEKNKEINIFSDTINDEYVNAIFNKQIFKGGNLTFHATGNINDLNGKFLIEDSSINNLAAINNLLTFVQTSPGLINPLLAIPSVVGMAGNSGFNVMAYKIVNGKIDFNYSKEKELLDIKKLATVGNGIDFDGYGQVDLNTMILTSNVKLIFLKDYSKIVGAIPVINYVLLGDNNRVETQVDIKGDIEDPEISTNFTKDTITAPVNIGKRILTSPSVLLDFIKEKTNLNSEEKNKEVK